MRNIPIHFLLLLCFLQRMYRLVIFLEMESVNIYSAFMSVDKLIYFAGDYISKYKNRKKYVSFFLCVLNGDYKARKCQLFGGLCLLLCGQCSVIRCIRYHLAIPRFNIFCFFKYSGTFKNNVNMLTSEYLTSPTDHNCFVCTHFQMTTSQQTNSFRC